MILNTDDMDQFLAELSRDYQEAKRAKAAARRRLLLFLAILAGSFAVGLILGPPLRSIIVKWLVASGQ